MKTNAKFRASRRLRFADTKRIMSPEMSPKSFGTFEKQAPGPMIRSVDRGQCFRVTPCFPDNLNKSSWSYETSVHRRGTLKLLGWSCTVRVYKGPRGALEHV